MGEENNNDDKLNNIENSTGFSLKDTSSEQASNSAYSVDVSPRPKGETEELFGEKKDKLTSNVNEEIINEPKKETQNNLGFSLKDTSSEQASNSAYSVDVAPRDASETNDLFGKKEENLGFSLKDTTNEQATNSAYSVDVAPRSAGETEELFGKKDSDATEQLSKEDVNAKEQLSQDNEGATEQLSQKEDDANMKNDYSSIGNTTMQNTTRQNTTMPTNMMNSSNLQKNVNIDSNPTVNANDGVNNNANNINNNRENGLNYDFWSDKANQSDIENNFAKKEVSLADDMLYPNQNKKESTNKAKKFNIKSTPVLVSVIAAVVVIVVGLVTLFLVNGKGLDIFDGLGSTTLEKTQVSEGDIKVMSDVSDVVEQAMPSVVAITETVHMQTNDFFYGETSKEVKGNGSGIIIAENNDELYVATNNHVVDKAEKLEVQFVDGSVVKGTEKGTDPAQDLAVVSIKKTDIKKDTLSKIKIASTADSDEVKVGDRVVAIGNALGQGQTVTAGYISAKDRELATEVGNMTVIQTDAAINPGNSGGALLNTNGEVIGINSAKSAGTEVEGMGYAIPITKAKKILDDMVNSVTYADDQKGFLGISATTVSKEQSEQYGWPVGVFVSELYDNGAAKEAGIKQKDIITKIDDYEVKDSSSLVKKLATYKKGSTVKITVMRRDDGEYKEKEIDVKLTGVLQKDEKDSSKKNDTEKNKEKKYDSGQSNDDDDYVPNVPNTLP